MRGEWRADSRQQSKTWSESSHHGDLEMKDMFASQTVLDRSLRFCALLGLFTLPLFSQGHKVPFPGAWTV